MITKTRGPGGDSQSGSKLATYGAIATAVIGAAATITVGVIDGDDGGHANSAIVTTIAVTPVVKSDALSSRFVIDGSGRVTAEGSAGSAIAGVAIQIGPNSTGSYWVGYAPVVDAKWQTAVQTVPPWHDYAIEVRPYYGHASSATQPASYEFTQQTTTASTPVPPPPNGVLECAQQFGPSCFDGTGFGPPAVYR